MLLAQEAELNLEYSCLAGLCASCSSLLISGVVHVPNADSSGYAKEEDRLFLPCCSYARSNLEVDL